MLAIFLGWPLAFGGGSNSGNIESKSGAKAATATVPAKQQMLQAVQAAVPAGTVAVESCYKRYQREVKLCSGTSSATCRLKSSDNWDLCEATGFWPDK
ncbi:hypothetical protein [Sphingomonas sp.]|uniref:hypothetical protein n=1 Tax=Sphingomonas sp. TaxID=28214 RepID=UPI001B2E6111|nr:hypothetical protein [Sphingomonas sp.]MBO9711952.1 hypothetical protein [Sphingomonas sp.]